MSPADPALTLAARDHWRAGGGCPVDRTAVTGDRWLLRIARDHESSLSDACSQAITKSGDVHGRWAQLGTTMLAVSNLIRAAALAAMLVLTAGSAMAEFATIEGDASYRERIALRPGAVLEVELLDISLADAPSERLASIRIRAQSQVPIPFVLHYDPAMIELNRTYAVTAKLILQGKVIFRSDTVHPVLTRGGGDTVNILMVRTAAEDAASAGPPEEGGAAGARDEAALVGPTWVAEDIGVGGVIDYLQSHITFTADGQAHGFGGCNHFTGGYTLDSATLSLGPLASTKKACPPAVMNQEASFHQALRQTRGYRFENGLLILTDAESVSVIRLWRRD
ncbi:MAG TPA: YbaY family lipoprotein [Geminicoccaceae bacterium]|nr:YbaY family lipoprotein [Geminicoccaceae bacterium]